MAMELEETTLNRSPYSERSTCFYHVKSNIKAQSSLIVVVGKQSRLPM